MGWWFDCHTYLRQCIAGFLEELQKYFEVEELEWDTAHTALLPPAHTDTSNHDAIQSDHQEECAEFLPQSHQDRFWILSLSRLT
jgi:hypothetical protein|eukprot:SAG25_NODE_533_length_7143_cov_4.173623_2_plen_84_part_00